jgi:hypothetical protein
MPDSTFKERMISPVEKSDLPSSENLSERSESFSELDAKKTFIHTRVNHGSMKVVVGSNDGPEERVRNASMLSGFASLGLYS